MTAGRGGRHADRVARSRSTSCWAAARSTPQDVALTATVLGAFALSIPFDALSQLLARGLYATHNTRAAGAGVAGRVRGHGRDHAAAREPGGDRVDPAGLRCRHGGQDRADGPRPAPAGCAGRPSRCPSLRPPDRTRLAFPGSRRVLVVRRPGLPARPASRAEAPRALEARPPDWAAPAVTGRIRRRHVPGRGLRPECLPHGQGRAQVRAAARPAVGSATDSRLIASTPSVRASEAASAPPR